MKRLICCAAVLLIVTGFASAQSQPAPADCTDAKAQITRLESRLADWPALARYREANLKVAPPSKDETRVVFMGDSITDNWIKPGFGGFFPDRPYLDRGISGQTTPQMLVRFHPDVIALQPRSVVILAGTNDLAGNTGPMTLPEIEANLAAMAELATVNHIRVVLASVLPVSDYEKTKEGKPIIQTARRPPEKIRELNEWIKKYVAEKRLTYLDYYSAMVDERGFLKAELSADGLHPNQPGYAVMTPLAEKAIADALRGNR